MAIQVEPYISDEDYDNPAMATDFYEFTMAIVSFCTAIKTPQWSLICSSAKILTI